MENLIRLICQKEGLAGRDIQVLRGGQVNQVFRVDGEYVLRIGAREDAFQRLQRETELLRGLAGKIPAPRVCAFGEYAGRVYQIQQFLPGQKLYLVWKDLRAEAREALVAELAGYLRILHGLDFPDFGAADGAGYASWPDWLAAKFRHTLEELDALHIRMAPGFVDLATGYFNEHRDALEGGSPVLVHSDLSFVNILVDNGKVSALLDFEYALRAPRDYELWVIEAFCLYPNDYAEDDQEVFCTADFASFIPLLRAHYPTLFEIPRLRERLNLYHLDAALGSYLSWRKDHLDTIPPDRMAAKEFYMARVTNFIFRNGVRLFC